MKKILIGVLWIFSLLFIVSCSTTISENYCTEDNDCIAESCCHSTESVNRDKAPDCQGVLCTASCEEGTLDCGFAKAKCIENSCTVVLVE